MDVIISSFYSAEVDKMSKFIKQAKASDTNVVDEAFLDSAKKGGAALFIKQHSISPWGGDVSIFYVLVVYKRSVWVVHVNCVLVVYATCVLIVYATCVLVCEVCTGCSMFYHLFVHCRGTYIYEWPHWW